MAEQASAAAEPVVVGDGSVTMTVRRALYPLDAVYGTAYLFLDRCFVRLDAPDAQRVAIELSGREALDPAGLRRLAGDFGNELLNQAWRHSLAEAHRSMMEALAAQALAGSGGASTADVMDELDFDDDAFDDPLGIAQSWEETYGKKVPGAKDGEGGANGEGQEA